jgi:hypothetical protein
MPHRRRLPNRRQHDVVNFEHRGVTYTVGYGFFDDDPTRPAEIFLNAAKAGSDVDDAARDAAVAVSIALQYGAEIETLLGAMARDPDGKVSGPLGKALELMRGRRSS